MNSVDNFFKMIKWDKSKYFIIPFLSILVVYILFNDFIMPVYTRHGQSIEVPNLIEMTYEGARTLLEQNDLEIVEKAKKFDDRFRAGIVISQNPKSYDVVKKKRRIYVIVSKGEPTIEMPRLIGSSEKNAVFEIERLGMKLRYIRREHSDHYHDGVVLNQSIPIGREVRTGQSIDLIVSMGKPPDEYVVPNLIGRSLKNAKMELLKSGLALGNVSYQIQNDLLPETVIAQSKEAETEVTQGDTISLLISKLATTAKDDF